MAKRAMHRRKPGSLKNGFNVVARDLDRAFALALSRNESILMILIREESWAATLIKRRKGQPMPKPRPAKINIAKLARETGMCRTRLGEAYRILIARKILTEVPGGVLINKNYEEWLAVGATGPLFTEEQLRWIRSAPARFPGWEPEDKQANGVAICDFQVSQNATPPVAECDTNMSQNATLSGAYCDTPNVNKEEETTDQTEGAERVSAPPEPPEWKALCDEADRIFRPHPTSFPNVLRGLWGVNAHVLAHWGQDWPPAAWRAALPALADAGPGKWNVGYYFAIVRRMAREGAADAARAAQPTPTPPRVEPDRSRPPKRYVKRNPEGNGRA